jgi:threonine/homoserine/homoserine lactone efflux protein
VLWNAIGDLLPSAVGVALSPIPIVAVVVMLGTPRARPNGTAFAIGWIAGLVAVSIIVLVLASGSDTPDSGSSTTVDIIKLVIGALFLAMAARQWRSRPRTGDEPVMPKWLAAVDQFTARRSAVLGAALSAANPKNLALTVASAGAIAQQGLGAGESAVAVAVFVVIGSITVAGPVVFYLAASDRAERPLASIKEFMSTHNAVILMVVLLVLGAKLVGNGIAGLTN